MKYLPPKLICMQKFVRNSRFFCRTHPLVKCDHVHGQTNRQSDIRTDGQNFSCRFLFREVQNVVKKKFQLDQKKKEDIDPIAIYVRRRSLSGFITRR